MLERLLKHYSVDHRNRHFNSDGPNLEGMCIMPIEEVVVNSNETVTLASKLAQRGGGGDSGIGTSVLFTLMALTITLANLGTSR